MMVMIGSMVVLKIKKTTSFLIKIKSFQPSEYSIEIQCRYRNLLVCVLLKLNAQTN